VKKKALFIQSLLFLAFLGVFLVLHLVLPDRDFSPQENRMLQTAPRFSFSELFSGRFTTNFESYVTDQFPLRDGWIALKARSELTAGKDANKDVYLCGDTLIEPYTAPEPSSLAFSLEAVSALADSADVPVYFALIPSPCEIWADMLPAGAPNDSQRETIDFCYESSTAKCVDLYSVLAAHAAEPIYYRTDHHWTTLGAYYGYTALAEAMGFEAVPLSDYTATVVSKQFYGSAANASGFRWVKPDTITRFVPQGEAVVTSYPEGAPVEIPLYDETQPDKYAYFFGGNSPLLTIDTGNNGPSLLILRDSYMDSLSPFLFAHFSRIHVLDLRYYRLSLKDHLAANDIDEILVCYNVKNFTTDGNIFLMAE